MNPLNDPSVEYLRALLGSRLAAARSSGDRGASAIEWAIITGLLAIIALAIFLIIQKKIVGAANKINTGP
jgi:Flp pilus assembly pilin Flp